MDSTSFYRGGWNNWFSAFEACLDSVLFCGGRIIEDDVHESGYVANIHHAVGIYVAYGFKCVGGLEDFVDEGGHIAHVHHAVGIHVAHTLARGEGLFFAVGGAGLGGNEGAVAVVSARF